MRNTSTCVEKTSNLCRVRAFGKKHLHVCGENLTEQNAKYDKKFDELYADRNRHENKLTEISTILMSITDKLNNMDAKIDKLAEAVNESHQTK